MSKLAIQVETTWIDILLATRNLPFGIDMEYKTCLGYFSISSNAERPLGVGYVPILLSEVEQGQRPNGNGDREALVVGAGLCDGEGERAYTVFDHPFFSITLAKFDIFDLTMSTEKIYRLSLST